MAHRRFRDPFSKRSTSAAVEDVVADAERSDRLVSLSQAAKVLGKNRSTLSEWRKKGMPVETAGDTGESTVVDLKRVVEWMVERAVAEERARFATPDPDGDAMKSLTPADMLKLEQLKLTRLKVAREAEITVLRSHAEAAFTRCLGLIRQAVMAVPERITREMAGFPEDRRLAWREKALDQCRAALTEGAKAIQEVMPDFEP